jgi:RNA polymerase sigma-70 factor (ECF subfamily)
MDVDFNSQTNDEAYFKTIYQDFYSGLFVFAIGYVKETAPAEDIVEDVFIKLWQNRSTIYAIKNGYV